MYVSTELLQTSADMAKLLEEVRFEDGHLTTFWVFLAGLLRDDLVEALLLSVVNPSAWRTCPPTWYRTLHLSRCFTESCFGERNIPSPTVGKYLEEVGADFCFASLSAPDCASIGTVLQCHAAHINTVWLAYVTLLGDQSGFAQVLSGATALQRYPEVLHMQQLLRSHSAAEVNHGSSNH